MSQDTLAAPNTCKAGGALAILGHGLIDETRLVEVLLVVLALRVREAVKLQIVLPVVVAGSGTGVVSTVGGSDSVVGVTVVAVGVPVITGMVGDICVTVVALGVGVTSEVSVLRCRHCFVLRVEELCEALALGSRLACGKRKHDTDRAERHL